MTNINQHQEHAQFDPTKKYVRFMERTDNGLVLFEFAIGDPDIVVEMLMPEDVLQDFCETNHVTILSALPEQPSLTADWSWRMSDATTHRFKSRTT